MFTNGQSVIADGRFATYAYANGDAHYVYTIAGLVRAHTVTATELGAYNDTNAVGPSALRAHVSLASRRPQRRPYCVPVAA